MQETLAPVEKAALFVVSLGRYIGPEVLARLEPGELELLRMGLSGLSRAHPLEIEFLHRDFYKGYMAADSMRLPVLAFLRRLLCVFFHQDDADDVLSEIAVDTRSMAEVLSIEHDRRFLLGFIRELEDTRDRLFLNVACSDWTSGGPAIESPLLRPAVRAVHRRPDLAARILKNWLAGDPALRLTGRPEVLSGRRRLALLLRTFTPQTAALCIKEAGSGFIREIAFEIFCAEDLSPRYREAVLVEATETLLQAGLIPGNRAGRARELTDLLRSPAWFCDLLRDMEVATVPANDLTGTATMRRQLARACSQAIRHSPERAAALLQGRYI